MEPTAVWHCPVCGEDNLTFVDLSAGSRQSYVEDCQVCCRPAILNITTDSEGEVRISAEAE
ncbi:MAG: CPXCG motif-containing cysteine-rich protein [Blastocatellia bacterium]